MSALDEALAEATRPSPAMTPPQPRSVPLWLPAAVLLLLFLTGFSWTVLQRPPSKASVRVPRQAVPVPLAPTSMPPRVMETQPPHMARTVYSRHAAVPPKPRLIVLELADRSVKPRLRKFHRIVAARTSVLRRQDPAGGSVSRLTLPDTGDGADPEADARTRKADWAQTQ